MEKASHSVEIQAGQGDQRGRDGNCLIFAMGGNAEGGRGGEAGGEARKYVPGKKSLPDLVDSTIC